MTLEIDVVDSEDSVIVEIARRRGVHPAVVCVKWAMQRGQVRIAFSVHRARYVANLPAAEAYDLAEKGKPARSVSCSTNNQSTRSPSP